MNEPDGGERRHTLKEVIDIIPESCYENPTGKAVPYIVRALLIYVAVLFGLASTDDPLLVAPLWLLAGLSVSGLFILGHDACHGALFKSRTLCRRLGRLLMLPALHVYSAWDMGHNRVHHSFTIRQDKDFVWHPLTEREYRDLSFWGKAMHWIEWSALGAGVYYLVEIWWKKMIALDPANKLARAIGEDKRYILYFTLGSLGLALAVGTGLGTSAAYALWVWCKLVVVPWLVFTHIIGATVYIHHIHPDIPWHADGLWSKFKGQVTGTTNIRVPALLNIFFHNIFVHIPHHVDPRIPFYHLPAAARAIKERYREMVYEQPFRWSHYLRATRRCKLYDFDNNHWVDYRGRTPQLTA